MRNERLPTERLKSLLVAYGNPELSKNFTDRVALAYPGIKLESSVEQAEETRRIATIYGPTISRVFTGSQASEERIKSDISAAKIVHFAGPVMLDDTSPTSSFIGLSSATTQQDGFLQTREITELQSTAELVVASATQQGTGFNGDAMVGYSWAWFVAGTPATLVTRWKVESPALSMLLTRFYSSIKPTSRIPVSKSRALHESLLAIRRSADHQHPYYWASFAIIGDAR
jgi:CHAT domain-containing protein